MRLSLFAGSLKGLLLGLICLLGAVLLALMVTIAATYRSAQDGRDSADLAGRVQAELQTHLRALNEAVLSDGSSSAVKLARESGARFESQLAELESRHAGDALAPTVAAVRASWAKVSTHATALLATKGLSASDDKSMIAYGKVAGLTEEVVAAARAVEDGVRSVADRAGSRLVLLGAVCAAASLLALALVGWRIHRAVFARLGGEPALARQLAARLAAYDLTVEFPPLRSDQEGTVMAALRQIRDSLVDVVQQVRRNSDSVATASQQIASGNNDLSERTGAQSGLLGQASGAMQVLAAAVERNASSAGQADQLASRAAGVARQGGEVVGQVVATMNGIHDSSRRIADIVGVIDGIAFQTNILALNAAVEAARAGEQGRGFAVVASEVRSLAQRSAAAAREIKALIDDSVGRVAQGTTLVGEAGATMGEIVAAVQRVNAIMGEISTASREQRDSVTQVDEVVGRMDSATQQNAALVEQSAAAAESLHQQAEQLVRAVAVFRVAVR